MTRVRSGRHRRMRAALPWMMAAGLLSTPGLPPVAGEALQAQEPAVVLRLGTPTGNPVEEFGDIRDLALLGDTAVLIADRLNFEARIFSMSGEFIRSLGSRGSGPEENRGFVAVGVRGDRIWLFDESLQRVQQWSVEGEMLRSVSLARGVEERGWLLGVFDDGSLLVRGSPSPVELGGFPWESGEVEVQVSLRRHGPEPGQVEELGSLPWGRLFVWVVGDAEGRGRVTYDPPFAPEPAAAAAGSGFWYTGGDHPRVERYDAEGNPSTSIPLPSVELRLATGRDREAFRERTLSRWGDRVRAVLAEMEYPDMLPAISGLVVSDDGGTACAGEHPTGVGDEPFRSWYCVSETAGREAEVRFPSGFELMAVTDSLFAGVERDELGVPYVVVYRVPDGS